MEQSAPFEAPPLLHHYPQLRVQPSLDLSYFSRDAMSRKTCATAVVMWIPQGFPNRTAQQPNASKQFGILTSPKARAGKCVAAMPRSSTCAREKAGMQNQYSTKPTDYYSGQRDDILPFIPRTCRRLLDVGCGEGAFGAAVRNQFGAEVWGVDPTDRVAARARANLDYFSQTAFPSPQSELPLKYFDVVTFNDSLEHLPDPKPALAAAREVLKSDGSLICCVPNVRYIENLRHLLIEQDWRYEPQGIRDYTHLRFFTKRSVVRTVEEAGFRVTSVTGIHPYYWIGRSLRPLMRIVGRWVEDMNFPQFVVIAMPRIE